MPALLDKVVSAFEKLDLFNGLEHVNPADMPFDSHVNYDWHRHECGVCGFVWAHDGKLSQKEFTDSQYLTAHTCPACKQESDKAWFCL